MLRGFKDTWTEEENYEGFSVNIKPTLSFTSTVKNVFKILNCQPISELIWRSKRISIKYIYFILIFTVSVVVITNI